MVPKHTNDRRVAAAFIQWIKDMNQYMKIPEPIQEIRKEDIPAMAKHVAAEGNPLYPVPVLMDAGELEIMYEKIIEKKEGKADAGKDSEAAGKISFRFTLIVCANRSYEIEKSQAFIPIGMKVWLLLNRTRCCPVRQTAPGLKSALDFSLFPVILKKLQIL